MLSRGSSTVVEVEGSADSSHNSCAGIKSTTAWYWRICGSITGWLTESVTFEWIVVGVGDVIQIDSIHHRDIVETTEFFSNSSKFPCWLINIVVCCLNAVSLWLWLFQEQNFYKTLKVVFQDAGRIVSFDITARCVWKVWSFLLDNPFVSGWPRAINFCKIQELQQNWSNWIRLSYQIP